jgi:four helix bundle suffix protein
MLDIARLLSHAGHPQTRLARRKAEIVHGFTFRFCEKHLRRGDRAIDRMIQAACAGEWNAAEGDRTDCATTTLQHLHAARTHLTELLASYQNFLRAHDFRLWDKHSREALFIRKLGKTPNESIETYRELLETRPACISANAAICLIHQANQLLDRSPSRIEMGHASHGAFARFAPRPARSGGRERERQSA